MTGGTFRATGSSRGFNQTGLSMAARTTGGTRSGDASPSATARSRDGSPTFSARGEGPKLADLTDYGHLGDPNDGSCKVTLSFIGTLKRKYKSVREAW